MANKMISGGFNPDKMVILNNFIDVGKAKKTDYKKEDYYCYVGRLSPEKGIRTLINAARQLPYKLKVIGKGDLLKELTENQEHLPIEFLGYKQWPEIREIMGKARFSVIPSECYENNPLSAIESLCLGTPVLGANIGGIPELIEENRNGMLFESGNIEALKDRIEKMYSIPFNYSVLAQKAQSDYLSENYYTKLMKIYSI
jgi:glycosyltransferase involved in cell wall biosynthesis